MASLPRRPTRVRFLGEASFSESRHAPTGKTARRPSRLLFLAASALLPRLGAFLPRGFLSRCRAFLATLGGLLATLGGLLAALSTALLRGRLLGLLTPSGPALFSAATLLVDSRPRPSLGFLLAGAALFVAFGDMLGLAFLFARVLGL